VVQSIGIIIKVQLSKGPIGCPETSVRNSQHSLRNNPEESSSQALIVFVMVVLYCDVMLETINNVILIFILSLTAISKLMPILTSVRFILCVCVCVFV